MMDSIRHVKRNDIKHYCFIEACCSIFPSTPKSTVRNWLKTLEIPTVICTQDERAFFRDGNAALSGSFGLISERDLRKLIEYRNASPRKRPVCKSSSSTSTTSNSNVFSEHLDTSLTTDTYLTTDYSSPSRFTDIVIYSDSSEDERPTDRPQECQPPANSPDLVNRTKTSILPLHDAPQPPANSPDLVKRRKTSNLLLHDAPQPPANSPDLVKRRKTSILPLHDAPEALKTEIGKLRTFYETPLNPLRHSEAMSKGYIDKMIERLLGFMLYCQSIENILYLSLSLFNNTNLYTKYVNYLKDERKLQPSTIVNFLSVAINIVKYYLKVEDPSIDIEQAPAIKAYRSFQRQFSRESNVLKKSAKEGLDKKSSQQFYFQHVLDTLRNLRDKYLESKGLEKARHLHNFVLLALFMRALPGRSQDVRTLQLYLESEKREPFDFSKFGTGNFIVFELGKNVYIVQSDFKTSKSLGPTKITLSDDEELCYYLRLYIASRPALMLGKSHDFFFLNSYGEPFPSSSSIAKYIGNIFDREVSIKASTTALRHALVTYFSSIDESKDVNVRKSLAALMKHSIRYQESVYNDQTYNEKTKVGRNLLRDKIAADIFGKSDVFVDEGDAKTAAEKNSGDELSVELAAEVGDIVALLDSVSSRASVTFFLAKVARFNSDRSEAHLVHLELLQGTENLYRLKPGKIWTEPVSALVFPVDVVYDSSEKAYELRTSGDEIFSVVHGR